MAFVFLTDNDFKVYASDELLADLTRGVAASRERAELAALEEIVSYLDSAKYDLALIFPTITEWTEAATFAADAYIHKGGILYQAVRENTAQEPAADVAAGEDGVGDDWKLSDPRHPLIIRYMVAITLYQLYLSLHGRQIPGHRVDEYDLAKDWLNKVADGKLSPRLPLVTYEEDTGADDVIKAGGLTRKDYQF